MVSESTSKTQNGIKDSAKMANYQFTEVIALSSDGPSRLIRLDVKAQTREQARRRGADAAMSIIGSRC